MHTCTKKIYYFQLLWIKTANKGNKDGYNCSGALSTLNLSLVLSLLSQRSEKKLFVQQNLLVVSEEEFGSVNDIFVEFAKYFLN